VVFSALDQLVPFEKEDIFASVGRYALPWRRALDRREPGETPAEADHAVASVGVVRERERRL
jgi:hypothetical protein